MGKALLIKNVDFSDVALDQVIIYDRIPCTGIRLSQSSASGTRVGDTVSIVATVTPYNTTDEVLWESDNPSVASVSASGVITINGIGAAIITATCGSQSATVSVNQTSLQFTDIASISGKRANNNGEMLAVSNDPTTCIGKPYSDLDNVRVYAGGGTPVIDAIPVPYGATSVTIMISERKYWSYLYLGDMNTLATYSGKQYAKYISKYSSFYTDVAKAVEYGQCIIFSASDANAALVSGLLFQ